MNTLETIKNAKSGILANLNILSVSRNYTNDIKNLAKSYYYLTAAEEIEIQRITKTNTLEKSLVNIEKEAIRSSIEAEKNAEAMSLIEKYTGGCRIIDE